MEKKAITKIQSIAVAAIILIAAIAGGYYYLTQQGVPNPSPSPSPTPTPSASPSPTPTPQPTTIVFALPQDALGFDPRRLLLSSENMIVDLMNDGLLRFKIVNGTMSSEVEPALAQSYNVSTDGLSYTFLMRHGLKFQDDESINATAVKFTFDSFMIKGNPLEPPAGANSWFGGYYGAGFVNSVEAVDEYTVRINLTKRYAPILSLLAAYYSCPLSPKALQALGPNGYHSTPTGGAGPFKFVEWVRNDHITLQAWGGYWGGNATINRIIFKIIPDSATRFLSLQRGEVDAIYGISPTDLAATKSNTNLLVASAPMLSTGFFYVNTAMPPLDDVRVRRALAYATDRQTMVKQLCGDMAVVANEVLPKGLWPWDANFSWYPYDLNMSKQLLAEAGYTANNPLRIEITAYDATPPYKPAGLQEDVAIAAMWAKAGIIATVKVVQSSVAQADRRAGIYQLICAGWTMDYADPDNFIGAANSPVKYCGWVNTTTWQPVHPDNPLNVEYINIVNQAAVSSSYEERVQLYKRAEEILKDQVVLIPITYPNNVIVMQKTVRNLTPPPIYYSWKLMWMNVNKVS